MRAALVKTKFCTPVLSVCWAYNTAPCQCSKLIDRGQLAAALHYTEFQAIISPSLKFQWRNVRASFPLGWTPLSAIMLILSERKWRAKVGRT